MFEGFYLIVLIYLRFVSIQFTVILDLTTTLIELTITIQFLKVGVLKIPFTLVHSFKISFKNQD